MPAGRPTKYDPGIVDVIKQYVETCGREQTKLPKRVDIALLLDVDDDTLVEWEKIHPEFSAAIKAVDKLQMSQLVDDGLYGGKEINSGMAIFLLKANHGMIETERKQLVGENNGAITVKVLDYGVDSHSTTKAESGPDEV